MAHISHSKEAAIQNKQVVDGTNQPHLYNKPVLGKVREMALQRFVQ